MPACPNCGFENAATAKFCSECGTALVTDPDRLTGRAGASRSFSQEEDSIDAMTPWWHDALGVARGDLAGEADILQGTGAVTFEAYARLRAAASLAAEGRHAEAAGQLASSLSFYRARGATRYVREGEALLAAAS